MPRPPKPPACSTTICLQEGEHSHTPRLGHYTLPHGCNRGVRDSLSAMHSLEGPPSKGLMHTATTRCSGGSAEAHG
jgi:hypothetical protein